MLSICALTSQIEVFGLKPLSSLLKLTAYYCTLGDYFNLWDPDYFNIWNPATYMGDLDHVPKS